MQQDFLYQEACGGAELSRHFVLTNLTPIGWVGGRVGFILKLTIWSPCAGVGRGCSYGGIVADASKSATVCPAEDARIADPVAGSVRVEAEQVISVGPILHLTRLHCASTCSHPTFFIYRNIASTIFFA